MNIKNLIIETFKNIKNPSKHRKDYNAAKGLDVFMHYSSKTWTTANERGCP